jgi:TetR/AcrR family acrAB operon transcriptional repressor
MKKTKEEASQTRDAVLEAALKAFSKKGYSGTSLETVAAEAGMTRGAIYWHFKNKFELLNAVLQECRIKTEIRLNRILDAPQSPLNKVRQLIYEFFLIVSEREEFRVMEEIQVFKSERKKELNRLYKEYMDNIKKTKKLLKELIIQGITEGEFDTRIDPDTVVVALISYISGVKSTWLSDVTTFSLKESAEGLADIFINGIAKK